eukprot:GSMAST32.ASY1.ANO1.1057.1 assembled CDS
MTTSSSQSENSNAKAVNVKVVVRVRPLNDKEEISADSSRNESSEGTHTKRYKYDNVFGQYATQKEVYEQTVQPLVEEVLDGFNCTVFAYGQTGTGKTFTMEAKNAEYTIKVSYLELYNEVLEDLLQGVANSPRLRIVDDKRKGIFCQNLEEVHVQSPDALYKVMRYAMRKRKVAGTIMNEKSSRSHCLFTLTVHIKETMPDVDLAGSESKKINQSLLTLGRVINALVSNSPHVPYRDSKLTRLLQESLGGRAKACIMYVLFFFKFRIFDETLSTLEYAIKAKSIKNRPEVNKRLTKRGLLKEYAQDIERLKSMYVLFFF